MGTTMMNSSKDWPHTRMDQALHSKGQFPALNSLLCLDNLDEVHYPILVYAKTLSKRKKILHDGS
jgi:hypothetical protein